MICLVKKEIVKKKGFYAIDYQANAFGEILFYFRSYGKLNKDKSNVVIIEHPLSYDINILKTDNDKNGWWDEVIKSGGVIDPKKHFIIIVSSHSILNSYLNLAKKDINFRHVSRVKEEILEYFGIKNIFALVGASFGGYQALEFACYSKKITIKNIILISCSHKSYKNHVLFRLIVREILDLSDHAKKENMHRLMRLLSSFIYRSPDAINAVGSADPQLVKEYISCVIQRFNLINPDLLSCYFDFLNTFDFSSELSNINAKVLLISSETDGFYTVSQMRDFYNELIKYGIVSKLKIISSVKGHDAFLLDQKVFSDAMSDFFALEAA